MKSIPPNHRQKIKYIAKHFFVAFSAVSLAATFLFPGEKLASKMFGIEDNFYLKYFYSILNCPEVDEKNFDDALVESIAIVDIENYRNRSDQSRILKKIYDCNPRVIGVDVFYGNNPDINDSVNSRFVETVDSIKNKTVFVCAYKNENDSIKTVYPFFYASFKKEDLLIASPLMSDFFDYYQSNDSIIMKKNSSSPNLTKICNAVVELSGIKMHNYDGDFYVNYLKKNLEQAIIRDTSEIIKENIHNKIVLVGSLKEMKDLYELPFRFGDQEYISGVEDIAYRVITLSSIGSIRARNEGFVEWESCKNVLLVFVVAILFSILQECYSKCKNDAKESFIIRGTILIILQPIFFLLVEGLIVCTSYLYTCMTNKIPNLLLCMITIALVGWSSELVDYFFKQYKQLQK